ncbi:hypothetical protein L226DRAFT_573254 [Lentinus tigrinus ALCF2SS1-7]|uniref:uncharacterized protein n=1 Tax=Lentinus tigrinus ALCF2SS1-7 TaxID=1328758 RepID=UPI001165F9F4|nr:hypothetical protein L226DRAFT_573254 [Lentinus tigrinus ALCF2SS1-7]
MSLGNIKRSILDWLRIELQNTNSSSEDITCPPSGEVEGTPPGDGSLCAIHILPAELLSLVFKDVLEDYLHGSTYCLSNRDEARVDTSSLIAITHVCRWWRDVAVGCPLFWSRIENGHIERSRTFLERSQDVPISLYLTTAGVSLRSQPFDVGSRLRRLDVHVLPEASDVISVLPRFASLPSLECVTLTHSHFALPVAPPLEGILLFEAPVLPLKALAIERVLKWIPTNSFPCLTHLYVDFSSRREDAMQLIKFVDVLRNAPRVEFVHVSEFSWAHGQSAPTTPPVPLRHLRLLLIGYTSMEVAFVLLASVILPRHAFVRLHDVFVHDRHPTLPSLPHLPVLEEVDQLELVTEGGSLRLVAECASSGLWLQCAFDLWESGSRRRLDRWLLGLLQTALPFRNVSTLLLSLGEHVDLISLLLPSFTGLTEIRLVTDIHYEKKAGQQMARRSVARALYASLAASPQGVSHVCPLLRTLCVDISVGSHPIIPNIYAPYIADMVSSRSEVGLPVLLVGVQPFAGSRWSGVSTFEEVDAQLMRIRDFNQVQILPPGPFLSPFLERLCWNFDEQEKYWDLDIMYKPMYNQ